MRTKNRSYFILVLLTSISIQGRSLYGNSEIVDIHAVNKEQRDEPMKYTVSNEYHSKSCDFRIKFIVLHYTVSDFKSALKELTEGPVSSHYLIPQQDVDGKKIAFQLVDENLRAWTEGVSYWKGRNNINDTAIGIEIVNAGNTEEGSKNTPFQPFTNSQIDIVIELCKDIIARYGINPTNIIGHADVAPGRKEDPGPAFPWEKLYNAGIGAWPDATDVKNFQETLPDHSDIKLVQEDLARYGYDVNVDGDFSEKTKQALISFQMHFRPSNYDGNADKETVAILKSLLKKYYTTSAK